jgi:Tol biopolymer transport system component/predicted Ser/Thr protein kinase
VGRTPCTSRAAAERLAGYRTLAQIPSSLRQAAAVADIAVQLGEALRDRYVIERELGHGGMATVYLAHDLRHDRSVALKVLRPELAAVLGAERFLNEVRVTANLQHPHILPLHDSGEAGGALFYVMPYVEGETLREKLRREKQLGIGEAVEITRAVAAALDYAHRHRVIHRDIKPENILLHEGQAFIVDFGIALAVSQAGGSRLTETGLSMGTPQYMSPEQAMGDRELDARSDIYSLGAVLYEMLAGDPPYTGSTAQAIVAKVITERPVPVTMHRDTVPARVAAVVHKALAKLPADRWSTAQAFADALAHPSAAAETVWSIPAVLPGRPSRIGRILSLVGHPAVPWALLAAAGLGFIGWRLRELSRAAEGEHVRATLQLASTDRLTFGGFDISRDGRRLVVSVERGGVFRLLLRRLDRPEFEPIAGTERSQRPFLSPDGKWVGFTAGGKLTKVPVDGGAAVVLADADWGGGSWGPDGTIVYTQSYTSGLRRVSAGGGKTDTLTTPDRARGELAHWWPQILPDGEHVLFTNFSTPIERARIEVLSLKSGSRKVLIEGGTFGRYLPTGHLIYARGGNLLAVPFDIRRLAVTGAAVPVLEGVGMNNSDGWAAFAISENGSLAYVPASILNPETRLLWVERSGAEQPVLDKPGHYAAPRLSPDGRRIALAIAVPGASSDVWIYELGREILTRFTRAPAAEFGPLWTPDGRRLIYDSERPVFDLYWRVADASQPEQRLLASEYDKYPSSISPDGRTLAAWLNVPGANEIWLVPLDGAGKPRSFLEAPFNLRHPSFSPNGRWLAYSSNESGQEEVVIQSYPDPGRAHRQVSIGGGTEPMWTKQGRELVYRNGDTTFAAAVDPATGETGRPGALFVGPYDFAAIGPRSYDVTPDGRRFLMVRYAPENEPRQVSLVLDWFGELRSRMGGGR